MFETIEANIIHINFVICWTIFRSNNNLLKGILTDLYRGRFNVSGVYIAKFLAFLVVLYCLFAPFGKILSMPSTLTAYYLNSAIQDKLWVSSCAIDQLLGHLGLCIIWNCQFMYGNILGNVWKQLKRISFSHLWIVELFKDQITIY